MIVEDNHFKQNQLAEMPLEKRIVWAICLILMITVAWLFGPMLFHWQPMYTLCTGGILVLIFGVPPVTRYLRGQEHHSRELQLIDADIKLKNDLAAIINKALNNGYNVEANVRDVAVRAIHPSTGCTINQFPDDGGGDDQGLPLLEMPLFPEPRDFASILELWRPSAHEIFLLDTVEEPVYAAMNKVCHVALGGPTGGGKTTCARLIVSQLLSCEAEMYMCNPNFAPVKLNGNRLEDWRPIVAKLKEPPVREIDDILNMFERFIDLVDMRRAQEQNSPARGNDVFLYIGEWPAIYSQAISKGNKVKNRLINQMGRLLRETRQYGVHVISEFQDALVSTIGGNSGVRENYGTCYYFGGDLNTAKVLLNLRTGESVDDTGLGKLGAVYMRGHGTPATSGRIPFFSNQAMYMLLGFPQDPVHDNLVNDPSNVPSFFPNMGGTVEGTIGTSEAEQLDGIFRESPDTFTAPLWGGEIINADFDTGPSKMPLNELPDILGTSPELSPNDLMMTNLQIIQFEVLYKALGNIKDSLRMIEGCNNRHHKHASWLVKQKDLRK